MPGLYRPELFQATCLRLRHPPVLAYRKNDRVDRWGAISRKNASSKSQRDAASKRKALVSKT